jgi:hypothetical protein
MAVELTRGDSGLSPGRPGADHFPGATGSDGSGWGILLGKNGLIAASTASMARSGAARMLVLRLKIGCSTQFQGSRAQTKVGGRVINVSRH